jgi:hypothetical protein
MKHKGLHTHRFKQNPEEKKFAQAWEKENEHGKLLAYLMTEGDQRYVVDATDDQKLVAATVIQWLGSPVGQNFLRDLGYVKTKDAA